MYRQGPSPAHRASPRFHPRRLVLQGGVLLWAAGCATSGPQPAGVGSAASPAPTQTFDITPTFLHLGRLAAGAPLPFVASVSFLAGPADSLVAIIALSMENRALTFQKEGASYLARYRVELTVSPASGEAIEVHRDQVVRVATLQEAQRDEETIFFQQNLRLLPGRYHVQVVVADQNGTARSEAEADVSALAFAPGSTSAPLLVYEVKARTRREDTPSLVANPRGLIANGGDTLLAYIEGYGLTAANHTIPFELRDAQDSVLLSDSLRFQGGREIEGRVLRLAPRGAPLGELRLSVGSGPDRRTTALFASISRHYVVGDFDQLLSLLRFFTDKKWLDSLRRATPDQRTRLWIDFWHATDPDTSTPQNEALDEYFARLNIADQQFRGEGIPGWQTARGEVYIHLGDPDEVTEGSATQSHVIRWTYAAFRLVLYFQDQNGVGRYELTPSSRADFEQALRELRSHPPPKQG